MDADNHYSNPASETLIDNSGLGMSLPIEPSISDTSKIETPTTTSAIPLVTLLSREESQQFRTRWNEIQGKFVDEPRTAVQSGG